MTSDLERIKILEGKISQVLDCVKRLTAENDKLKQQLKETKSEKKEFEEQTRKLARLEEIVKTSESDREAVKARIEALIGQIDALGL